MQVELAQLEYMLPRLTRMWTHLEKFRGGIGMRGPGETQLETDRRLINHRIKILRERLLDVQRGRAIQRQSRQIAVQGVARRLHERRKVVDSASATGARTFSSRTGSSRRSILSRATSTSATTRTCLLTDTVGFIRKLPHHLVASFRATLEEDERRGSAAPRHRRELADVGGTADVVAQVLDELGVADKPTLLVFNKIDLLDHDALLALQERIGTLVPSSIFVSTVTDGGLEPLRRALASAIRVRQHRSRESSCRRPTERCWRKSTAAGEVLEQRMEGDQLLVEARVDEALAGRLRRAGAEVTTRNGTSALVH